MKVDQNEHSIYICFFLSDMKKKKSIYLSLYLYHHNSPPLMCVCEGGFFVCTPMHIFFFPLSFSGCLRTTLDREFLKIWHDLCCVPYNWVFYFCGTRQASFCCTASLVLDSTKIGLRNWPQYQQTVFVLQDLVSGGCTFCFQFWLYSFLR